MKKTEKGPNAGPIELKNQETIKFRELEKYRLHSKNIDHTEIPEDSVSKPLSIAEILNLPEFDGIRIKRSMK